MQVIKIAAFTIFVLFTIMKCFYSISDSFIFNKNLISATFACFVLLYLQEISVIKFSLSFVLKCSAFIRYLTNTFHLKP